ncbi:MAG: ATP-binding protein [Chitinophaga sp.]
MEPIINSPFKFLDPYGREDYNIFFGRDEEINQLYQHIHKNRLVLVYGTSGTGKTSIVQCGLMNRMDDVDWKPFFIRRGDNINDSLLGNLKVALSGKTEPETRVAAALAGKSVLVQAPAPMHTNVIKASNVCDEVYEHLKNVNLRYLRSVYLIFDQFEELLIMGTDAEKQTFMRIVDRVLSDPELQFCSMLFIMREEFFAGLSEFEKEIPDFCDRRLRIEPMNARNVEEVIVKSCREFGIQLQEGADNAKQIISVLIEKGVVSLPYLQIYLDQLWRAVYMITPVKTTAPGPNYPALTFNNAVIKRFGGMQEVLERFIRERITVIQDQLETEFPGIPEDFVSNVLDAFVTPEGTKRPLAYVRINDGIWFTGQVPAYLQKRAGNIMIRCLNEMEKNKILRTEGLTYELAHDVLAGLIDKRRTEEQRRAGFTDQQIRSRYTGYQKSISELLSNKEIESYRPYIEQLNLPPEIIAFYEASVKQRDTIAQQRAAEAQKLQKMKERQRRWKWGWILGGILLVASTALYFYSQMLRREYNRNESLVFMGYEMKDLDPVEALNLFGPIKEKVYGEDTNKVNQQLLEFMQTQHIQQKFSRYTNYLPVSLIEPGRIDISADGNFIVLDTTGENVRSKLRDYAILNQNGHKIGEYGAISYVYFTNKNNILLLCRKGVEEQDRKRTSVGKYRQQQYTKRNYETPPDDGKYQPESPLPTEFILFDCIAKKGEVIRLGGAKRYLHAGDDVEEGPFTEFDSYRVRFTDNGNLVVPYMEMNSEGYLEDKLELLDAHGQFLREMPSDVTVTTTRDASKILTLAEPEAGMNYMDVYDRNGSLLYHKYNVNYGDFTEDGSLIWGMGRRVNVLSGHDTLRFACEEPHYYTYVYGNLSRKKLLARMTLRPSFESVLELIDMHSNARQRFPELLVAVNFEKDVFITRNKAPEYMPVGPLDTLTAVYYKKSFLPWYKGRSADLAQPPDTLWRHDLSGRLSAPAYTHPDGFAALQYNRVKDELVLLTNQNKLIILDKDFKEKTAMQLTANDRFGLSDNGEVLYYVRDRWLSVFPNDLPLHVFDASRVWPQLEKPPLKMEVSRQRRRDLGLTFK